MLRGWVTHPTNVVTGQLLAAGVLQLARPSADAKAGHRLGSSAAEDSVEVRAGESQLGSVRLVSMWVDRVRGEVGCRIAPPASPPSAPPPPTTSGDGVSFIAALSAFLSFLELLLQVSDTIRADNSA